ncbi:hypothetical protein [Alkalilimnicola sp. S0819]|uniref:hypothetical protein n=1 Tax=Alkalilimnicola sp. S0819 TaxID=2613922 RepID=UPI0012622A72|nr:hypothetical protein [Alkalilimnicola sp. S0819]KAB7619492.1 hypothetical protein F3N43_13695 [Alkalilimnicola sp. S0819]MPQ17690.1 hypothetical protein [Alkalilimnicola sp. S0819]
MNNSEKLELHYYFQDQSHTIDAIVRNKCETELLALVHEVSRVIGAKILIEAEPSAEGGFRDIWRAIGENQNQLTLILLVVTLILSRIPVGDREHADLQKELTQLSIEEKQLSIEKLQRDLDTGEVTHEAIEAARVVAESEPKVITRKSNFYRHINNYEKVTKVSVRRLDGGGHPLEDERPVERRDFSRFIIASSDLPPLVIDNAIIEIVSPVLKEGTYKWKGLYDGGLIGFNMADSEFRAAVLSERVSFKHGTAIECVLKIGRKLDEAGDVVVTGYSVVVVLKKIDGFSSSEMPQGRRFKDTRQKQRGQGDLFTQLER